MSSESKILASIWCMATPNEPVAKVLHAGCLAYLESKRLIRVINITELPTEVHFQIIRNMPYLDRMSLKGTSHQFRDVVSGFHIHKELLAVELGDHARAMDLLACKFCVRLRSKSKFADAMRTGKTGRNGLQRYRRFCLDCGIQNKVYALGSLISVDATMCLICSECREPKRWNGCSRRPRVDKNDRSSRGLQYCLETCAGCSWKGSMKELMQLQNICKGQQDAYAKPKWHRRS
ncbi:hypothetical protein MFRU_035g00590 [Monilinia fructicola]|nr:hypothetical protein MFRU_035g00590 [Monilinia fructicola]